VNYLSQQQVSSTFAARELHLSPRTLRHWKQHQPLNSVRPRGRRPVSCSAEQRNQVIHFLHEITGPNVSQESVRCLFKDVPACVIHDLVTRYKRVWRRRYARRGYRLTWNSPGRVWAIDHSESQHLIDGRFGYLFAVRDLASHQQLAWDACEGTGASEAVAILGNLFMVHGPPLILKSDNGSAFTSAAMQDLLNETGVAWLPNPPRRPQYNGALERSNGTLKTYTHQQAIRLGHPLRWTSEDLEQARLLANTITRPWGRMGSNPEEAWQSRSTLSHIERTQFQQELAQQYRIGTTDLALEGLSDLNRRQQGQLDRLAVSRTAEAKGYLTIRRDHRSERARFVNKRKAKRLANEFQQELKQSARGHSCCHAASERSSEKNLALTESCGTMTPAAAFNTMTTDIN